MTRKQEVAAIVALILTGCAGGGAGTAPSNPPPAIVPTSAPVVFIGDSITQRWNLAGDANPLLSQLVPGSIDAGVSGETSEQMLARFASDVLAQHPATVVILAGTNDLRTQGTPNTDAVAQMAQDAAASGARVILAKIPASPLLYTDTAGDSTLTAANNQASIQEWNSELASLAASYGYTVVDYYSALLDASGAPDASLFVDGIHPTAAGYTRMAAKLQVAL